ncbi:DUF333 domain-containing protein [Mesorhizobium australicum]|uniref:putative hemolysin n=1 Tax=Mesorhizobium australicum TaxID=536018 RepID=UPI00333D599C
MRPLLGDRDEESLDIGRQPCLGVVDADRRRCRRAKIGRHCNPASAHCGAIGGRFAVRKDRAGNEYGFCRLPNGRLCEEWALFRDNKCVGPKAGMHAK